MRWIIAMYSASIRSRSSGKRSARKLSGTPCSKRAGAPCLVGAEDPAAALLADVPFRVGVAQHRVLAVVLR